MSCVIRMQDLTILELDRDFASLNEDGLVEFGGILLSEATYAEPPRLLLDFAQTQFIGSRFIELLVRAWTRLKRRQGSTVLCNLQPLCREVLHITRLDTLWETYPARDTAVSAIGPR